MKGSRLSEFVLSIVLAFGLSIIVSYVFQLTFIQSVLIGFAIGIVIGTLIMGTGHIIVERHVLSKELKDEEVDMADVTRWHTRLIKTENSNNPDIYRHNPNLCNLYTVYYMGI